MIYDKLSRLNRYFSMGGRIEKALRFLSDTDFSTLEDGRHDIEGDDIYALISSYQTKTPVGAVPEGHSRYIDLQYVLSGEEEVLCGFIEDMTREVENKPQSDFALYEGAASPLTIGNDRFLLLFPGDIHAPSIMHIAPSQVRKVVVKIKIE